jgi:hypothetical protein
MITMCVYQITDVFSSFLTVMDISTMISVTTLKADGSEFKHQVKPLDIIWSKFPQFSSKNTIHVDDLSRNFALNPNCGLKISAFKHAPVKRLTDRELYYVARYLLLIVNVDDFTTLNHKVSNPSLYWGLTLVYIIKDVFFAALEELSWCARMRQH